MSPDNTSLPDKLKSWPLVILPHQLLSRFVRVVSRWQANWWKNPLIKLFIHYFNVDMTEADAPGAEDYADFNSFFIRSLKPSARSFPDDPMAIASPVDGCVSEAGNITAGRLLQAKGRDYSLLTLLGGNEKLTNTFQNGKFATLYLSPRDYHRIHMPSDGCLIETTYIPGRLFSVAPHTTRTIPGLFARNERLVTIFDTPAGPMALIMVGAIFVSCMETVWGGTVNPTMGMTLETAHFGHPGTLSVELQCGEEMGRFNMGSTVILLYGPNQVEWVETLQQGQHLCMGQTIGKVIAAT